MKICTKCKLNLSLDAFHRNCQAKDGRQSKCKVCKKEYYTAWYPKNVALVKKQTKSYYLNNNGRERATERYKQLKALVLREYGGACACCSETAPEFLTIDHIAGNGALQRRTLKHKSIYRWLKRQGFPKDNFQLLCYNCNCAKGVGKVCPHKREKEKLAQQTSTLVFVEPRGPAP